MHDLAQSTVPPVSSESDSSAVELGVKFRTSQAGVISGIRFYKGSANTGVHVGNLWTSNGVNLGAVTFTGETSSGWQEASFATPISVEADTTYVASYHAPNGGYALDGGGLSAGVTNGVLTALGSGVDGGNGVYVYGSGGFPSNTFNDANYFVDVVFDSDVADTTAPTVTSRAPVSGATGLGISTTVEATFSEPINPTTPQISIAPTDGSPVAATSSYDVVTRTLTLDPDVALDEGTEYTVDLAGAADAAGNVMAPTSWVFTTATASSSNCPCSIWPVVTVPSTPAANDTSAVELGVKFESSQAGYVTGVRFYKGVGNSGTHVGTLWNETGTPLASVTFTDESASGWQQAEFAAPVAVDADTTYVVSYFAPNGRYSLEGGTFTSDVTNGILTARSSGAVGGNGVYAYGGGGFPTNTFNASNYFVDVVFVDDAVDSTAPTVVGQAPAPGSTSASVAAPIGATFSETVVESTVNMTLTGPGSSAVTGTTGYNASSRTALFTPDADLDFSTPYTVTVSGAQDAAGNTMVIDSWTFTTAAPPPPLPTDGPGGPIGVVDLRRRSVLRLLRRDPPSRGPEPVRRPSTSPTSTPPKLANFTTVLARPRHPHGRQQVNELTTWVNGGGNLIASRPDPQLAPLLGLTPAGGLALTEGYLQVDTGTEAGAGIVGETMQFHGTADRYTLAGASRRCHALQRPRRRRPRTRRSPCATSGRTAARPQRSPTTWPARSSTPARATRPGSARSATMAMAIIRSERPVLRRSRTTDWVDLDKVAIPQADEQQRSARQPDPGGQPRRQARCRGSGTSPTTTRRWSS